MAEDARKPILILGIGNILCRDEGVGVHLIEAMRKEALPPDVEIFDGGTFGAELIDVIADRPLVIVIDAMESDQPAGVVLKFSGYELATQQGDSLSLHEVGLLDTLRMARQLKCAPAEVVVFGVVPKDISEGVELSAQVAAVVPQVVQLVLAEAVKPR